MNYQDMSYRSIDLEVFQTLFGKDVFTKDADLRRAWGRGISYCNSWADAGRIAEENFISFDQHYNGSYAKVWGYSDKGRHEVSVLRRDLKKGICIVFLMMKGGA